jgi:hypothetical protein
LFVREKRELIRGLIRARELRELNKRGRELYKLIRLLGGVSG